MEGVAEGVMEESYSQGRGTGLGRWGHLCTDLDVGRTQGRTGRRLQCPVCLGQ